MTEVTIIGRIGRDAEVKQTREGKNFLSFSVGQTVDYKMRGIYAKQKPDGSISTSLKVNASTVSVHRSPKFASEQTSMDSGWQGQSQGQAQPQGGGGSQWGQQNAAPQGGGSNSWGSSSNEPF